MNTKPKTSSPNTQPNDARQPAACPCCGLAEPQRTVDPSDSKGRDPDETPCRFCRERMKKGILLIEVEDWGGGPPGEPRRTGRAACIAEAGLRRCVRSPELVEHTLRKRYAYVSQAAWKSFGLAKAGEGEVN
jgi:hypothetical protein